MGLILGKKHNVLILEQTKRFRDSLP